MSHMTIELASGAELFHEQIDDENLPGWWMDGNAVTVRTGLTTSTYRLPRGRARVSVMRLSRGRSQLVIGGFTSTTVVVNGPNPAIWQLREVVL